MQRIIVVCDAGAIAFTRRGPIVEHWSGYIINLQTGTPEVEYHRVASPQKYLSPAV
jgi:hypothetical protein